MALHDLIDTQIAEELIPPYPLHYSQWVSYSDQIIIDMGVCPYFQHGYYLNALDLELKR